MGLIQRLIIHQYYRNFVNIVDSLYETICSANRIYIFVCTSDLTRTANGIEQKLYFNRIIYIE